jgi:ABC-type polysaccharide/polyol phosphate transport system ATPase subunit
VPDVAIDAQQVSKQFFLRHNRSLSIKSRVVGLLHQRQRERVEPFWALRDISLTIRRGDRVGLIGRNGSGKSTLLKLIAGIHRPTRGRLLVSRGATIGTMIELGVGFHPELTGTENVYLSAAIHGRTRDEIDAIYPKIVEYSGLDRFMDVPLKNYSSGMQMRLGFAIAANLEPDIILLDEVFAVGDEDFQKKCMATMDRFSESGRTILFVSHSMPAIRLMCRRVCVLDAGALRFDGDAETGIAEYFRLLATPAATAGVAAAAESWETMDVYAQARRQLAAWAVGMLRREGGDHAARVLQIGTERAADPDGPMLRQFGTSRYTYWQVGTTEPSPVLADVVIAPTVFLHYPLNGIARIIASGLRHLAPGGRFYATFFEAPHMDALEPKVWPLGFATSPDTVPYHYAYEMIEGLVAAFGATMTRVPHAEHPNGETTVVIRW